MQRTPKTEAFLDELGLTPDDKERIQRYLQKPSYERTADDLRPSDE